MFGNLASITAMLGALSVSACVAGLNTRDLPGPTLVEGTAQQPLTSGNPTAEPLYQGSAYAFRWTVDPGRPEAALALNCTVESLRLAEADASYLAPGTKCDESFGVSVERTAVAGSNRVDFGLQLEIPTDIRGAYRMQVAISDTIGKSATSTMEFMVKENTVREGRLLELDAAFARGEAVNAATGQTWMGGPPVDCKVDGWRDLSGHDRASTVTGFASCSPTLGWNGTGSAFDPYRLSFDQSLSYFDFADSAALNPQSITLEAWARTRRVSDQAILHKWSWSPSAYTLEIYTSRIAIVGWPTLVGQSDNVAPTSVPLNTWQHWVGSYNAATGMYRTYVNGAEVAFRAVTASPLAVDSVKLRLGARTDTPNVGRFDGDIARVVIYDRALSAAEIARNCEALRPRFLGAVCD